MVLVILLVISLVIIAYQFVYRTRLKSPNTETNSAETTNDENNLQHNDDTANGIDDIANGIDDIANDIADDYEQVDNEQSTYTALKRRGPGEKDDDHVYAHLINQVPQNVFETRV